MRYRNIRLNANNDADGVRCHSWSILRLVWVIVRRHPLHPTFDVHRIIVVVIDNLNAISQTTKQTDNLRRLNCSWLSILTTKDSHYCRQQRTHLLRRQVTK